MNKIRLLLLLAVAAVALSACGTVTPPATTHKLTVKTAGAGAGSVTVSVDGGAAKPYSSAMNIDDGAKVVLTATPDAGSQFDSWSAGCDTTATNTCTITKMTADKTITATFEPAAPGGPFNLAVTVSGNGVGTVASDDSNINCSYDGSSQTGDCSFADYASGSTVTLTATADGTSGSSFAGWGGDCSGIDTTCTVTVNADTNVTASFVVGTTISVTLADDNNNAEEFVDGAGANSCPNVPSAEYQTPGAIDTTGTKFIELGYAPNWCTPQVVGLRFPGLDIPAGATVQSAYLKLVPYNKPTGAGAGVGSGTFTLTVAAATSDPGAFADSRDAAGAANQVSGLATTTDSMTWNVDPSTWTAGTAVESPNQDQLATVLNDVVSQGGWASGNAIVLVLSSNDADASNFANIYKTESAATTDATFAPTLVVTYTPAAP